METQKRIGSDKPGEEMTAIAYFGHDATDAAIRRRVQAFGDDGCQVTGFMMRRRDITETSWHNVDLGLTRDGAFVQRIKTIFSGARKAASERELLAGADVFYARNLDMLACAFLAKRYTKLDTPVIYECLDVHRLLCRPDPIGLVLRAIERSLLKRSRLLVVSSPGFLKHYFEKYHAGLYQACVLENRMAEGADYGPRPVEGAKPDTGPLRLGWFGNLRCQRSYDLLMALADKFGDALEISLHGQPALKEIPEFHAGIEARPNVSFGGRYKAPEDLARLYAGVDVVWAGDFMEAGLNSVWLLPNRLYEGGYYGTPPIAPAGTETAAWIETHQCGFIRGESLEDKLPALMADLIRDRSPVAKKQAVLLGLADSVFIQPKGEMRKIIDQASGDET